MNEHEERMMDVALEEVIGEKAPPDLRSKILDRAAAVGSGRIDSVGGGRPRAALAIAAALVLCLGVFWTVVRERGVSPGSANRDEGKVELTYRLLFPDTFGGDRKDAAARTRAVLDRRLETRGIRGAKVSVEEDTHVRVTLPPVDRATLQQCMELIVLPGRLELNVAAPKDTQEAFNKDKKVPEGYKVVSVPADQRRDAEYEAWGQGEVLVRTEPLLENKHIVQAEPREVVDPAGTRWTTFVEVDDAGARRLDEAAKELYHRRPPGLIAILLDGRLRSIPAVQSESFGGHATITALKNEAEAQAFSVVLKAGSLPVPLGRLKDGKPEPGEPELLRFLGPDK